MMHRLSCVSYVDLVSHSEHRPFLLMRFFSFWVANHSLTHNIQEVFVYRLSLLVAAISLSLGTLLALSATPNPIAEWSLDLCAVGFLASFGVSLTTIHIYLKPLHNMLKVEPISNWSSPFCFTQFSLIALCRERRFGLAEPSALLVLLLLYHHTTSFYQQFNILNYFLLPDGYSWH
jgi:hypothetical protein